MNVHEIETNVQRQKKKQLYKNKRENKDSYNSIIKNTIL